ncbi:MAG TPA: HprK-related kinase A [Alphaproteobacteria bacterium]|nr:HprK-related kinase A [Alphaproteobacteria bacterium]
MPTRAEFASWLAGAGAFIRTGPFIIHARTPIAHAIEGITTLYDGYPVTPAEPFADFHVALAASGGLRRFVRRQVDFEFDGEKPYRPLPLDQALPMFEWGLNAVIGGTAHQFLIVHAAVVARDGFAAILPAQSGSGKSTLCAALVNRGWRLLSDELTLFSVETGAIHPLARPMNLKNESIEVIRNFVPGAVLSRPTHDTVKGTVALLKAPAESVARAQETARPAWIVSPLWQRGALCELTPKSRADTMIELGQNAFNYSVHGRRGFHLLADAVERCACFDLRYSVLDEAVTAFAALEIPAAARAA